MRTASIGAAAFAAFVLALSIHAGAQSICRSTDARGNVKYSDCGPAATYSPEGRRPAPPAEDTPPAPPGPPPPTVAPAGQPPSTVAPAGQPPAAPAPAAPSPRVETPSELLRPPAGATPSPSTKWQSGVIAVFARRRPSLLAGAALMVVGLTVNVLSTIQYLIRAFRVGVWWGLGCLFVAPVNLLFLVLHWPMVKKPFLVSLLGTALLAVGVVIAKGL